MTLDSQWSYLKTSFNANTGLSSYSIENYKNGIKAIAEVKGALLYYEGQTLQEELMSLISKTRNLASKEKLQEAVYSKAICTGDPNVTVSIEIPMNKNFISNKGRLDQMLSSTAKKISPLFVPSPE